MYVCMYVCKTRGPALGANWNSCDRVTMPVVTRSGSSVVTLHVR